VLSLDLHPALYGPLALAPGRLVVVGPAVTSTGGAVANVGVALHRLGVPVRLVAKVGDDLFGRGLLEALAQHGAHLADDVTVVAAECTSYTIVISPPGVDRAFLHCPGATATFAPDDVPYARLRGIRIFHFGYPPLMPAMYANAGAGLREMFARVRELGAATSLDLCEPDPDSDAGRVDWEAVLAHVLPAVDVFAPSISELLFMLDRPAHEQLHGGAALRDVVDRARLAGLADALLRMGAAVVAIKLGDQGLYLRSADDPVRVDAFCARTGGLDARAWRACEVHSPCFAPRAVAGTTGSGDATVAGLLAALLRGAGPADAATSATAVGGFSVEAIDPTSAIPAWPLVAARVADGWARLRLELDLGGAEHVECDALGTLVLTR